MWFFSLSFYIICISRSYFVCWVCWFLRFFFLLLVFVWNDRVIQWFSCFLVFFPQLTAIFLHIPKKYCINYLCLIRTAFIERCEHNKNLNRLKSLFSMFGTLLHIIRIPICLDEYSSLFLLWYMNPSVSFVGAYQIVFFILKYSKNREKESMSEKGCLGRLKTRDFNYCLCWFVLDCAGLYGFVLVCTGLY